MYYHARPLKFVKYGKIEPVWLEDSWLNMNYKWLGQFCGYAPQLWLSKGDVSMTGFKNKLESYNKDDILFAFDIIKGFPVSYDPWCFTLNAFLSSNAVYNNASIDDLNTKFETFLDESWKMYYDDDPEENCTEPYMRDIDTFKEYLFKEVDQVVLPTLNLKSAKQLICRNEKQKKALRKKGFINDRIKIIPMKRLNY